MTSLKFDGAGFKNTTAAAGLKALLTVLASAWVAIAALTAFMALMAFIAVWPGHAAAQSRAGLPDFADLVEQVSPSVVNIRVMRKISSLQAEALRGGAEDDDDDTPQAPGSQPQTVPPQIAELLRRFGIPLPQNNTPNPTNPPKADGSAKPTTPVAPAQPEREVQRGVGSGFVLSSDGLIMTNAHVVAKADTLLVRLTDKREFKAKVIGADKRSDIALLKIEASSLPAVKLGNVQRLRVGEWVLAIGSPFNLDNTVTAGIVSGKHRDTGDLVPKIQTDVAINPGNSGGPLINMRGEVVGVNSMIYSNVGGYLGVSFAIPIDEAQRIATQLQAGGKVERGMLGVEMAPVSAELATALGLDKPQGVFVRRVVPGTGSDTAGVQAGDVILKFDNTAVEKPADLQRIVFAQPPGYQGKLTVLRGGKTLELPITLSNLAQLDQPATPTPNANAPAAPKAVARLNVEARDLTAAEKEALKMTGAYVAVVQPGASFGLQAGDIVVRLGNAPITGLESLQKAIESLDGKAAAVYFRRGNSLAYTVLPAAK